MSAEVTDDAATTPLAFNTRDGKPLDSAGVFRDAEGNWWSVQARKPTVMELRPSKGVITLPHSTMQDENNRAGHISFVRLQKRPAWLTDKDVSNLAVALQLNIVRYGGKVQLFRSQDEADDSFKEAHRGRKLFVR